MAIFKRARSLAWNSPLMSGLEREEGSLRLGPDESQEEAQAEGRAFVQVMGSIS